MSLFLSRLFLLTLLLAVLAATPALAQSATKQFSTRPLMSYTFDANPSTVTFPTAGPQNQGASIFEYSAGAGSRAGVVALNGTGYIDLSTFLDDNGGNFSSVLFGADVSFEMWISYMSLNSWSRVFDFGLGQANNNIYLTNQGVTTYFEFTGFQTTSPGVYQYTSYTLPTGVQTYSWQHIVCTITRNPSSTVASTAATYSLYLNGAAVGTPVTGYLPFVMLRNRNYLGRSNWESATNVDQRFNGLIDDFFIYNYTLGAEAVAAHYVVQRVPVFELTFTADPRINMNLVGNALTTYGWSSVDSTDTTANQAAHAGLLSLNGTQFLDVALASGYSQVGTDMPVLGGDGWRYATTFTTGWTFEAAFKLASVQSGACVYDYGTPSATAGQPANNRIALCVSSGALTFEVSNAQSRATHTLLTGVIASRWYHVLVIVQAVSVAQGTARFEAYVDGQPVPVLQTGAWPLAVARSNAFIGRSSVSTAPGLQGFVDSVRVFDYAVTPSEARQLYLAVSRDNTITSRGAALYNTAPTTSHTFDVQLSSSQRTGSPFSWQQMVVGRSGVAQLSSGNSQYLNLLALSDRNYRPLPATIGGRSISFEFWVMWTSFSGSQRLLDLTASPSSSVFQDIIAVTTTAASTGASDPATLAFSLLAGTAGNTLYTATSATPVSVSRWYHLVVTVDVDRTVSPATADNAAQLNIFLDGVLVGSTSSSAPRSVARNNNFIGRSAPSTTTYASAYVDAFHYYDYALLLEQVRAHFLLQRPPQFELTFVEVPTEMPGFNYQPSYSWVANDTLTSTPQGQANHRGLLKLSAAQFQYVDLASSIGGNSTGALLPLLADQATHTTTIASYDFPDTNGVAAMRAGLTIEMSFLYTSASGANAKLLSCGATQTADLIELGWRAGDRNLMFSVANTEFGTSSSASVIANAFYSKWHHVAIVLSRYNAADGQATWRVYVNGALANTYSNYVFPYATPRDMCVLGRSVSASTTSYVDGYVDSFRVYDYALNATEVLNLYTAINAVADPAVGVNPTPLPSSSAVPSSSVPLTSSSVALTSSSVPLLSSSVPLASSSAANIDAASSSSDSLSSGAIAGIVIGACVGVLLVVLLVVFAMRSSKSSSSSSHHAQRDANESVELSDVSGDDTA